MTSTFGKAGFRAAANGVPSLSAGIPAAVYPGRIATNSDLIVAVDRQQTSLLLQMNPGDGSMTVLNPSAVVAYSLLSIDNEIVKATGPPAGNVVPISRGFDGTTAATHASGTAVLGLVDAYHHNVLVAEVEAIETALGPNLANVSSAPIKYSNQFNFGPITPGGSLTIGANTITLPLPPGITSDSVGVSQLYISGGTGSSEVVPIIGVGAGTVTVTCLNTHSGAWTIQSATSGVQEAVIATAGYGRAQMPGGIITFQNSAGASTVTGCVTIPGNYNTSLRGFGKGVTDIHCGGLTGDRIWFKQGSSQYLDVGGFSIRDSSTTMHTAGSMVRASYKVYGLVDDIEVENGWFDITLEACQNVSVRNCIGGTNKVGLYITTFGAVGSGIQSSVNVNSCSFSVASNNGSAFKIEDQTVGVTITSCIGNAAIPAPGNRALEIDCSSTLGNTNEIVIVGGLFDAGGIGIYLVGDGVNYNDNMLVFTGVECAGSEYGFYADAKIQNIRYVGGLIKAAGGTAQQSIFLRGVTNCSFVGVGLECLGANGITTEGAGVTDLLFDSVTVGKNSSTPTTALTFNGPAVRTVIQNCDFGACANKIANPAGAGNPLKIVNNIGIDDVIPTIASAATITQPVNPSANVTGTTTITTITPIGVVGTRLRLIKKDAGSLTVGGGGNIPGTHAMAQNTSLDLEWDGSAWL